MSTVAPYTKARTTLQSKAGFPASDATAQDKQAHLGPTDKPYIGKAMAMLIARDNLRYEMSQVSKSGATWDEFTERLTPNDVDTKDLEEQWRRMKQCSQLIGKLNVLRTGRMSFDRVGRSLVLDVDSCTKIGS
jgi:putative heme degradation protein